MKKIKNLHSVKATVLPARVMVLLSKYAQAVKDYEGVIIQLSSLNVFKHVHASYTRSKHPAVQVCYKYLLKEVNRQLLDGNMVASSEEVEVQQQGTPEFDERYRNPNFWRKSRRDYSVSAIKSI